MRRRKSSKRSAKDPRVAEIMAALDTAEASQSTSVAQTASTILAFDADRLFKAMMVDEWTDAGAIRSIVREYAFACPASELEELLERARSEVANAKQWDREKAARAALVVLGMDEEAAEHAIDDIVKQLGRDADAAPQTETIQ